MKLDRLLDEPARARIVAAVRTAEAKSEAQVVPVVVTRSTGHSEALYRGALAGAVLATLLVFWRDSGASLRLLVYLQALGGAAGALLASVPPLERLLLGRRALAEAAWRRAERAFLEHHLDRTEKRTGVLLFASLFERQAVVLGDEGIHAEMAEGGWRAAAEALTDGLRSGRAADGFCAAIALCGDKLAEHFPRNNGDSRNELPDTLQVERS
ncbi:MAG TPA: hypothetical protein VMB50_02400 [Myxococcales bacterium]|nr:hypothetical protein [Myxococcales bacterium]